MTRPSRARAIRVLGVAGLVAVVGLVGACGDDTPSKTEFSTEISRVTGGKVDQELGDCIYDKLGEGDAKLLRRAMSTPNLSEAEEDKITSLLAQCIVERDDENLDESPDTTSGDDGSGNGDGDGDGDGSDEAP